MVIKQGKRYIIEQALNTIYFGCSREVDCEFTSWNRQPGRMDCFPSAANNHTLRVVSTQQIIEDKVTVAVMVVIIIDKKMSSSNIILPLWMTGYETSMHFTPGFDPRMDG